MQMHTPTAIQPARTPLRPLGSFERWFWVMNEAKSIHFSLVTNFSGIRKVEVWENAFAQLQKKHPLLTASIVQDRGGEPGFMREHTSPIPLRTLSRENASQWQHELEREMAVPFQPASGPLLRAVLLQGDNVCDLILTAHHSIIDAVAMLELFRELLSVPESDRTTPLAVPACMEERIASIASPIPDAQPAQTPVFPLKHLTFVSAAGLPRFQCLRISKERTSFLLDLVHREHTTLHAAFSAAVAIALRKLSPDLQEAGIRIFSPIDARKILGGEIDCVLATSGGTAMADPQTNDFWALARSLQQQLTPFQTAEAMATTFAGIGSLLAANPDSQSLAHAFAEKYGYEVMLSNLKTVEFPASTDGLIVEAIWGPTLTYGIEGEQTIGVVTFNGALHLSHISSTPVIGLLAAIEATVVALRSE